MMFAVPTATEVMLPGLSTIATCSSEDLWVTLLSEAFSGAPVAFTTPFFAKQNNRFLGKPKKGFPRL